MIHSAGVNHAHECQSLLAAEPILSYVSVQYVGAGAHWALAAVSAMLAPAMHWRGPHAC